MVNKSANIKIDNLSDIQLPIYHPSIGNPVIDIAKLGSEGYFTFDPGFMSTAACESKITYIDGDQGILLYRGYPIDQLAAKKDFLDVCYLLLNGELPKPQEKQDFQQQIKLHTMVHQQIHHFFNGFRRNAHPMAIMVGVVGALSAFYHESTDLSNAEDRYTAAIRLVAKVPTLAAMSYKHCIGQPFVYPSNDLNYAENFLYMLFGLPSRTFEQNKPHPVLAEAMDIIFTLHADHEQNASTSTCQSLCLYLCWYFSPVGTSAWWRK